VLQNISIKNCVQPTLLYINASLNKCNPFCLKSCKITRNIGACGTPLRQHCRMHQQIHNKKHWHNNQHTLNSKVGQRLIDGWMDGWLGFNGILSTQVAAISCLKELLKFISKASGHIGYISLFGWKSAEVLNYHCSTRHRHHCHCKHSCMLSGTNCEASNSNLTQHGTHQPWTN